VLWNKASSTAGRKRHSRFVADAGFISDNAPTTAALLTDRIMGLLNIICTKLLFALLLLATCRQSASDQCTILAEPAIVEKNSSSVIADSVPDNLGTRKTKHGSLWTVGEGPWLTDS
jgi:hypothetical protein